MKPEKTEGEGGFNMVTVTLSKTAREFMTAFNSHDLEKVAASCMNDCLSEDAGSGKVFHGQQERKNFYQDLFTAFPDVKIEIKSEISSGDWSANEWMMTGTNTGKLPASWNMPKSTATNKKASWKGVSFIQARDGKSIHESHYWNPIPMMEQLGLISEKTSR